MSAAVAVVVPCYNAASTLAETLVSALEQDAPTEVVVIDDGSTDSSAAIARSFEPKLRVIGGSHLGVSAARNTGIANTTAEWIVFLDADDMLEPGTLGRRLTAAETVNADVEICDWVEIYDDGRGELVLGSRRSIDWSALKVDPELAAAEHVWATTAAILYSRAIVERIGGFRADLPIIQDARFLFDAAYHGARFARSEHVGAKYRIQPQSLSRRDPARFWQDVLRNGIQIEALWQARGELSPQQSSALLGIYNNSARGLFAAESPDYFQAVDRQHALKNSMPLHSRIAPPLARLVGLSRARRMLAWVGR
jgi:Glycosyl transferase family 2